jgi:hypothetical protein
MKSGRNPSGVFRPLIASSGFCRRMTAPFFRTTCLSLNALNCFLKSIAGAMDSPKSRFSSLFSVSSSTIPPRMMSETGEQIRTNRFRPNATA